MSKIYLLTVTGKADSSPIQIREAWSSYELAAKSVGRIMQSFNEIVRLDSKIQILDLDPEHL